MAAYRGTFVAAGQQVTDAPAGYRNSLKLTVSTAQGSLGANDELSVLIPIEGVRTARLALGTASAAPISLGFWVKAHRTGTYSGALRNSAKNRSYPFTFAVSSADTWEFKTLSVGGDTSGTWLADTGVGLSLNICVAGGTSRNGTAGTWAGSDYSGAASTTNSVAATSDTFQITGVIAVPGIELPSCGSRRADHATRRSGTALVPALLRAVRRGLPRRCDQHDQPAGHLPVPCAKAKCGADRFVWHFRSRQTKSTIPVSGISR